MIKPIFKIFILSLSLLAVACSDDDGKGAQNSASKINAVPELNVIQGFINNATGGTNYANVLVQLNVGTKSQSTLTGANGYFRLPLVEITYDELPTEFSVEAKRADLVNSTIEFTKGDGDLNLDQNAEFFPVKSTQMWPKVTDAEVTVNVAESIVHLGDSSFGGAANSQFQFPEAEGESKTWTFNVDAESLAKFDYFELAVKARGIQATDIEVQVNNANALDTPELQLTPDDGSSSEQRVLLSKDFFVEGENTLTITTTLTAFNLTDVDDFEILNITLRMGSNLCPQYVEDPLKIVFHDEELVLLCTY